MNNSREPIRQDSRETHLERWREEAREEGRGRRYQSAVERPGGSGLGMALIGAMATAVVGGAGACLYSIRPRDPIFEVKEIILKGLKLRFCTDSPMLMAVVDVELVLSIKVTNENVVPIEYTSTIMDIFYRGDLLGQAQVHEGSQSANSSRIIEVPCKLDGLEMTNHVKDLFRDVAKREMNLHAIVTIAGHALLWKWKHNFEVCISPYTAHLVLQCLQQSILKPTISNIHVAIPNLRGGLQ